MAVRNRVRSAERAGALDEMSVLVLRRVPGDTARGAPPVRRSAGPPVRARLANSHRRVTVR
jgi:hypothetical protein